VGCLEYGFAFHTNTGEVVGIEKSAVVDVVGGDPPVGQAEGLRFDEFVQFFEACGIGRRAVYQVDGSKNACGDLLGSRTQLDQSALWISLSRLRSAYDRCLSCLPGRCEAVIRL
jgi:hypothetical protein